MPFIGRDWRSPGEAWVKTESLGWQRMKLVVSQLHTPNCHQSSACSWPPKGEYGTHMKKHCDQHDSSSSQGSNQSIWTNENALESRPSGSPTNSTINNHDNTKENIEETNRSVQLQWGQYPICCPYHLHHKSPDGSDKISSGVDNSGHNAQKINRSLSPNFTGSNHKEDTNLQKMKYNNSVSDFRSSSLISACIPDRKGEEKEGFVQSETSSSHELGSRELICNREATSNSPSTSPIKDQDIKGNTLERNNSILQSNCRICNCSTICPCTKSTVCKDHHHRHHQEQCIKTAPHCRISVKTREVAMYNTISEAFYRLDFCNAIHDIRRFNYICKLLHILITENLTSLSGCATKVLFNLLEQVAWEVSSNKRNIHVIRNLLEELKQIIQNYYCWGRPIGSSALWQQHFDTIERISRIVDGIELSPPKNDSDLKFDNLPVEMIREILLRLNDYRDLVNSAEASPVMRTMVDSQYVWKRLCRYHFTEQQLRLAFSDRDIPLVSNCVQRGIKYARTLSGDGKGSYRNPVPGHKVNNHNRLKSQTIWKQQDEKGEIRISRRSKVNTGASIEPASTSYVTKSVGIFDNDKDHATKSKCETTNVQYGNRKSHSSKRNIRPENGTPTFYSNRLYGQEIDWENIFHQLRKKFALKEEYADCLLLCRQCRCLFWKSIGHPCLINEDHLDDTRCRGNGAGSLSQNVCNCDKNVNYNQRSQPESNESAPGNSGNCSSQHERRPSVAILSRNFNNMAQRSSMNSDENANQPIPANERDNPRSGHEQGGRPFRELSDGFNGRPRIMDSVNNGNNGAGHRARAKMVQELVPKHVTISPQAFLKFFSL